MKFILLNRDLYLKGCTRVHEKYLNSTVEILNWIIENGGYTDELHRGRIDGCSDLYFYYRWSEVERRIKATITSMKEDIEYSKDEKKDEASKLLQSILSNITSNNFYVYNFNRFLQ